MRWEGLDPRANRRALALQAARVRVWLCHRGHIALRRPLAPQCPCLEERDGRTRHTVAGLLGATAPPGDLATSGGISGRHDLGKALASGGQGPGLPLNSPRGTRRPSAWRGPALVTTCPPCQRSGATSADLCPPICQMPFVQTAPVPMTNSQRKRENAIPLSKHLDLTTFPDVRNTELWGCVRVSVEASGAMAVPRAGTRACCPSPRRELPRRLGWL